MPSQEILIHSPFIKTYWKFCRHIGKLCLQYGFNYSVCHIIFSQAVIQSTQSFLQIHNCYKYVNHYLAATVYTMTHYCVCFGENAQEKGVVHCNKRGSLDIACTLNSNICTIQRKQCKIWLIKIKTIKHFHQRMKIYDCIKIAFKILNETFNERKSISSHTLKWWLQEFKGWVVVKKLFSSSVNYKKHLVSAKIIKIELWKTVFDNLTNQSST